MCMGKRQIFDQVSHMETQIGHLYEELGDLKEKLSEIIEENHRLVVENQHLREYLDSNKNQAGDGYKKGIDQADVPSEGIDNLARIYSEGFHICHVHFGSPRSGTDENCLFCLGLID